MAKKNRCYLCGGKLLDGRCQDCGLDNMRNYRKHFHLNESDSVESMNGDTGQASVECDVKGGQLPENAGGQVLRPVERIPGSGNSAAQQIQNAPAGTMGNFQNAGRNQHGHYQNTSGPNPIPGWTLRNGRRYPAPSVPTAGGVKIAVAVIGLIVVLAVFISDYVQEHNRDSGAAYEDGYASEPVTGEEGPYEFVERELSETGDVFETELGQGEYLVGVHLPEGSYTAELLDGSGNFSVDDFENGIYLWQAFGTDTEYDETEYMEDIRLYQGARVSVTDGVILRMRTENGRTEKLETMDNPLTKEVSLKEDETVVVGEGCPAGVYDLSAKKEDTWALLRCRIPDDSYEEGYYERSYWISGEERDDLYRNIYLKEGMEITAEESPLLLTPSEVIGTGDYEEYYKNY